MQTAFDENTTRDVRGVFLDVSKAFDKVWHDGFIFKLKTYDTSLFSKVLNINESANDLNFDLEKISQWAYQWKMQFNPDPNKQANEVIFSR